ncbi:sulfite exporter TauE/SafE family protein [Leeia oryzae]|uniref:sulfite exporter TauE/SafE family protein n=1 Tax=Leeia oryzae TaxID=356662 RepID=UPI000379B277|nr:sulfite exporter TauE/SafE family protein [Leeia oryzae]
MVWLGLWVCGMLTGITSILFGFGGGFVLVPLLAYVLPLLLGDATTGYLHLAIATATLVMCGNASLASWVQWRAGKLANIPVRLLVWIALGATLGAWAGMQLSARYLKVAFLVYLAFSWLDAVCRPGFLHRKRELQNEGLFAACWLQLPIGLAVGSIAAMLGVGGSVMTTPWLRRQGYAMQQATAMANLLSLPVAMAGSMVYLQMAPAGRAGSSGFIAGAIYWPAAIILMCSAGLGMQVAIRLLPRLPDKWHAYGYLGLLGVVILAMVFV